MTVNQVALKQWGNSLGIRIPKSILAELDIDGSDMLQISVENKPLYLEKVSNIRLLRKEWQNTITTYPCVNMTGVSRKERRFCDRFFSGRYNQGKRIQG